ncbi:MAG: dTDP-glucose 4,6-dehydratase [Candidatus Omnitrophota bacterium]
MRKKLHKIIVTGGAGFIGSEFVRQMAMQNHKLVVIDQLTYAGDLDRLAPVKGKYVFYRANICDVHKINAIIKKEKPEALVHFAAESHVDRSIVDATPFIDTNIKGTQVLLDASRNNNVKKFIHISTDEVYGEIKKGQFFESSPIKPNSPYAAAKASADLLVQSYIRTYRFPACIVRPSNNYGLWQYPEKFIPVATLAVLKNKKIPVYGRGLNMREWLHVSDCALAIKIVLEQASPGEIYNIGSGQEMRNIDMARMIIKFLGKSDRLIKYVKDRAGHDFRYSLNIGKIRKELGWKPQVKLDAGIRETVEWYSQSKYLNFFKEK